MENSKNNEVVVAEKKEFTKIAEKDYKANAFVIEYRNAKERKAHLAKLGRQVPANEKNWGEARIIIEGRPYWVALNFGGVYKGTRLPVVYLKDVNGEIYRRSITAIKPTK